VAPAASRGDDTVAIIARATTRNLTFMRFRRLLHVDEGVNVLLNSIRTSRSTLSPVDIVDGMSLVNSGCHRDPHGTEGTKHKNHGVHFGSGG
jgi:hypothetical protein